MDDISDKMDILDGDQDQLNPLNLDEATKSIYAFGRSIEWLSPYDGLELLLVNKTCFKLCRRLFLNNILVNYQINDATRQIIW